jgi:hypothetical protein
MPLAKIKKFAQAYRRPRMAYPYSVLTRPVGNFYISLSRPGVIIVPIWERGDMVEMADLFERKSLKLLAQAGQTLNQIVGEGLCDEPQKDLMRRMLTELRVMLGEFEEAYFDD